MSVKERNLNWIGLELERGGMSVEDIKAQLKRYSRKSNAVLINVIKQMRIRAIDRGTDVQDMFEYRVTRPMLYNEGQGRWDVTVRQGHYIRSCSAEGAVLKAALDFDDEAFDVQEVSKDHLINNEIRTYTRDGEYITTRIHLPANVVAQEARA